MQPFAERHGLTAAMVAPTKIIAGLGASLGIDILHVRPLLCTGQWSCAFLSTRSSAREACDDLASCIDEHTNNRNARSSNERIDLGLEFVHRTACLVSKTSMGAVESLCSYP